MCRVEAREGVALLTRMAKSVARWDGTRCGWSSERDADWNSRGDAGVHWPRCCDVASASAVFVKVIASGHSKCKMFVHRKRWMKSSRYLPQNRHPLCGLHLISIIGSDKLCLLTCAIVARHCVWRWVLCSPHRVVFVIARRCSFAFNFALAFVLLPTIPNGTCLLLSPTLAPRFISITHRQVIPLPSSIIAAVGVDVSSSLPFRKGVCQSYRQHLPRPSKNKLPLIRSELNSRLSSSPTWRQPFRMEAWNVRVDFPNGCWPGCRWVIQQVKVIPCQRSVC